MNQPDPSPQTPSRKYTTEDLFGDILSDLEGTPRPAAIPAAPAPRPPVAAAPQAVETVPERAPGLAEPVAEPALEVLVTVPEALESIPERAPASVKPVAEPALEILETVPEVLETVPEVLKTVPEPPPPPDAPEEPATLAGAPAPDGPESITPAQVESLAPAQAESLAPAQPESLAPAQPESPAPAHAESTAPDAQAESTTPDAQAAVPEEEPCLEQFGNYNLLERVAVGGMAELFKARQRGVQRSDRIVAIKRILPHLSDNDDFVRMFIDEAKLAAQLSHPNIVQIFDLGKAGGSYYIAMEFVDGRDLRSLLRKAREYRLPVPEALAAGIIMKVASALDYAHRKRAIDDKELRLVHRDISPQNILISFDGAVKLVDFGIAKAASKSGQTQSGALKGKLLYMSPEQALGGPLDGRSDLYSLGLVLAELLTGERCFQADSELGVLEKVRLGKMVPARAVNPSISKEMGTILDKVLQKDMDLRYASARLLERDLKELLAEGNAEPSDGDLADYVHTMLKGTREDVEALLATRYPVPPEGPAREPAAPAPPVSAAPARNLEDAPTLPGVDIPIPAPVPATARPRVISAAARPRPVRPVRPGWVVAFLAVAAAAAAWLLLR